MPGWFSCRHLSAAFLFLVWAASALRAQPKAIPGIKGQLSRW